MAAEVAAPFTDEQLHGEAVGKKDIATFIQANASEQFLLNHKLKGVIKNVVKTKTKEQLVEDYKQLFATKSFRTGDEEPVSPTEKNATKDHPKGSAGAAKDGAKVTEKAKKPDVKVQEPVKFTKKIIKTGDKTSYPTKGDDVECWYTGKLADGKVFDTNVEDAKKPGKKNTPLRFKVGAGKVIRGWDEALQTMTRGEKAEIVIQPDWAYGRKGLEGKIPPNSTLTFEVELVNIL